MNGHDAIPLRLKIPCEIAAGGVPAAVVAVIFVLKFGDLLSWSG